MPHNFYPSTKSFFLPIITLINSILQAFTPSPCHRFAKTGSNLFIQLLFNIHELTTFAQTHKQEYCMEYINEFHKQWIERTRQSIASWSKQPASLEEAKKQQERLNQQRAIREGKSKN